MSRAIADTSVFIAREADRPPGDLPDEVVASCYARLADQQLRAGRKPRRHDTWIAAIAMRHNAVVLTQDQDLTTFGATEVVHV
jgi:predicted nucleic acid-binding protein